MPEFDPNDSRLNADFTPISPDADGRVDAGPGVRRANNKPKIIGLAVFSALMALVLWQIWGADGKASKEASPPEPTLSSEGMTNDQVAKLSGRPRGVILPDMPPEPPGEPAPPAPQLQPIQPTAQPQPAPVPEVDQTRQRFEQMKLAAFQAAIAAASRVNYQSPDQTPGAGEARGAGSAGGPEAAGIPSYAERIAAAQRAAAQGYADAGSGADGYGPYGPSGGAENGGIARMGMYRAGGTELLNRDPAGDGKWILGAGVQAPVTPYEVMTGTVIPATMITGINSDLPGQMVAQVSQNVYDTPRGRHLLIPQGTRLIGQYSHSVAYGQERVLVAWNRLVFPDGKSLDIGAMPGATGAGYSGLKDQVDNHYLRIFGSAFLMSMITGGMVYGVDKFDDDGSDDDVSASDALAQALAVQIGNTALQLIERNLSIAPTLEIRPGFRFNVVVTKDMVFRGPYQAFDYEGAR